MISASDPPKSDAYAAVAGSVLSVVASRAGFYTGHHLGADGRQKAENARAAEEDARRTCQRAATVSRFDY